MKLVVVGVGPGGVDHVTVGALGAVQEADLVLVPRSGAGMPGVAEGALA